MRAIHRWVMTVFIVLLAYWACSGVLMNVYDFVDPAQAWAREGGGPGARSPDRIGDIDLLHGATLTAEQIGPMVTAAVAGAGRLGVGGSVTSVELSAPDDRPRATLLTSGSDRRRLVIDTASGGLLEESAIPISPQVVTAATLHSRIKSWHRGNAMGNVGVVLGFLAGCSLIVMIVTGVGTYIPLLRSRQRSGRRAWFWNSGASLMRNLHRSIGIAAAAFLLHMAITGLILEWPNAVGAFRPSAPPPRNLPLPLSSVPTWMQSAYRLAREASPAAPLLALRVNMGGGEPRGAATFGGADRGLLLLDPVKGGYIISIAGENGPGGADLDSHTWMKRLHRGDFIGAKAGRLLAILAGLSLIFFVVSGAVMYGQLLKRRWAMGRRGLMWRH